MALTSKQKYGIAFGIFGLGLILLLIFWNKIFPKKEKCPNGKDIPADGDCTKVMTQQQITNYTNTGNTNTTSGGKPTPPNGGSTQGGLSSCTQPLVYVPESFPLAKGMFGPNVGILQKKLGGLAVDERFGCMTEDIVWKVFQRPVISKTLFDTQINK